MITILISLNLFFLPHWMTTRQCNHVICDTSDSQYCETIVGDTILNTKILGNSNIETDIGKLELNLIGSLNDYELTIDKGVGSIKLNNESLKDKKVWAREYNMFNSKVDHLKYPDVTTYYRFTEYEDGKIS